jgi:mono/diheme cytochrome c family protein
MHPVGLTDESVCPTLLSKDFHPCRAGAFACQPSSSRLLTVAVLALALATAACRQDMHDQPKFIPLRPSTFFDDGRSARPLMEGTVARGQLHDDAAFYTGKGPDGKPLDAFPLPVTKEIVERGQDRFDIYCAPCHGRLGNGDGMIVRRGFRRPPSYHIDRLRSAPNGYLYDVISKGFGAMPDYAAQIEPADRWAIVAYIRALQLSQNASVNDAPPAALGQLTGGSR